MKRSLIVFMCLCLLPACGKLQPSSDFDAYQSGNPGPIPKASIPEQEESQTETPTQIADDGEQQPGDFGANNADDLPQFSHESTSLSGSQK